MKNLIPICAILLLASIFLCSCAEIKVTQIGKLNMISNRNIDSKGQYVLLKNYMGASTREIKRAKATTLEDAIDVTVKNTSGGEYLKNVKIYLVQNDNKNYYAIEGDVWGIQGQENFRGFVVGDLVQWKDMLGNTRKGKITGLKDSQECMVKEEGKEDSKAISFDKVTKVSE
jgi:hypothetical protein